MKKMGPGRKDWCGKCEGGVGDKGGGFEDWWMGRNRAKGC